MTTALPAAALVAAAAFAAMLYARAVLRSRRVPLRPLPPETDEEKIARWNREAAAEREQAGDDLGQVLREKFHDLDKELDDLLGGGDQHG